MASARVAPVAHAAGIGVLDDGDGRRAGRFELAGQLERRVGVVDVVVGQLFALQLARRSDAGALLAGAVETCLLMRVLAHNA